MEEIFVVYSSDDACKYKYPYIHHRKIYAYYREWYELDYNGYVYDSSSGIIYSDLKNGIEAKKECFKTYFGTYFLLDDGKYEYRPSQIREIQLYKKKVPVWYNCPLKIKVSPEFNIVSEGWSIFCNGERYLYPSRRRETLVIEQSAGSSRDITIIELVYECNKWSTLEELSLPPGDYFITGSIHVSGYTCCQEIPPAKIILDCQVICEIPLKVPDKFLDNITVNTYIPIDKCFNLLYPGTLQFETFPDLQTDTNLYLQKIF